MFKETGKLFAFKLNCITDSNAIQSRGAVFEKYQQYEVQFKHTVF